MANSKKEKKKKNSWPSKYLVWWIIRQSVQWLPANTGCRVECLAKIWRRSQEHLGWLRTLRKDRVWGPFCSWPGAVPGRHRGDLEGWQQRCMQEAGTESESAASLG